MNNAFFLFSPPPPPPKRRRSSMSSNFGSKFAMTSSSSTLSSMKLTPRTGICATALARMRYLSSLFVFFSPRFMPQTRRRFIEKFLLYNNRTSDPTPNTRRAVAKIHALQKAKGKEEKKIKMKTTSTTAATTNTKNTNKKKKDESALAKVIANKEDSPSNEVIVETIESATFGELRTCFPLVFDGKLTSSNNKEWLKAVFKRKMVTDKTYEFVPRTRYSSKNRLNKKKKTEGEEQEQEQEATNASTENTLQECAQKTPLTPLEEENREEEDLKKEVVFSIEVARLEEQPRGNENVNETIATDANTTANDEQKMRELSSFFTKTFSAVSPLLGTRL